MRKSYAHYFKNKFKLCQFINITIYSQVLNKQTFSKNVLQ